MPFAVVSAITAVAGVAVAADSARGAANRQNDALGLEKTAADRQAALAERQQQMAEASYSRYLKTYAPLEDEMVNESRNYGSNANREKLAAESSGAVTASYAGLRERLNSTPGLDPSSAQYLNTMSKLGVSEAGQTAAAANEARSKVDAIGTAKLSDAVSLGKGLPATSAASMAGAANSAYGAANTFGNVARGASGQLQTANQGLGGAWASVGSALSNPGLQKTVGGWFNGGMAANDPYGYGMTNSSTNYGTGTDGIALTNLPTAGGG